jgi:hypothetical protein
VGDVRDGAFPAEEESFSLAPARKPRKAAGVAAVAHVGGCAAPAPSPDDATSEEGVYSTIDRR